MLAITYKRPPQHTHCSVDRASLMRKPKLH
jgi:hypothetical protein